MNKMLNNNSKEMKTQVEVFIIEETASLIYDDVQLEQWNKQVEELGLVGQTKIVTKDKSPIPFMFIKTSMIEVFNVLCPKKVKIEQYDCTPIPVEILELVVLSKRENYFSKIEIWYDDKTLDPICVGVKENRYCYMYAGPGKTGGSTKYDNVSEETIKENKLLSNYYFDGTEVKATYLIGKWADVKHSFEELTQMATKRFMRDKENEYKNQIKDAERALVDLENEAYTKFN